MLHRFGDSGKEAAAAFVSEVAFRFLLSDIGNSRDPAGLRVGGTCQRTSYMEAYDS